MSEDIELMSVSEMERLYVKGSHREMFNVAIKLKQRVEKLEKELLQIEINLSTGVFGNF